MACELMYMRNSLDAQNGFDCMFYHYSCSLSEHMVTLASYPGHSNGYMHVCCIKTLSLLALILFPILAMNDNCFNHVCILLAILTT